MKSILLILLLPSLLLAQITYLKTNLKQVWYDSDNEHATSWANFDSSCVKLNKTAGGKWELEFINNSGTTYFKIDSTGFNSLNAYGEMFFADSSVTIAVSASNTWYQITNSTDNLFTDNITENVTYVSGDTLRIDKAGDYLIDFGVGLNYGSNRFKTAIAINGTVQDGKKLFSLSANDEIVLKIQNTIDTEDPIVTDAFLMVKKLN